MIEFFQAGGFAMIFVLLFGVLALVAAGAFVHRPTRSKEDIVRALGRTLIWCSLGGVVAGLAAVGAKVPATPQWAHDPDLHLIVMTGISEALSSAVLGFNLLALVWLIMAVGHRRWAARREEA